MRKLSRLIIILLFFGNYDLEVPDVVGRPLPASVPTADRSPVPPRLRLLFKLTHDRAAPDPTTFPALHAQAKAGEPNAAYELALYYLDNADSPEAVTWFEAAASRKHAEAQYALGLCHAFGIGFPKDQDEAIKWYRMAAKRGSAAAQFELGLAYGHGAGVPEDTMQAILWSAMAAEQGYADAQVFLGLSYALGTRVSQDFSEAVKWLTKATEQGNVDACFYLGLVHVIAHRTLEDTREAAKWFTKAAEQGHAEAQFWLAQEYHKGEGVLQDYKEAARWFTKAAEQGHAKAQSWLGDMHHNGEGVRQDYKEAAKWRTRAAEQGDAVAQSNLGRMYAYGQGVLEDYVEAYKWSILAAMNGAEKAPRFKQMLRERMTPAQVEEGQRRAKEFTAAQQGRLESREALGVITVTTATGFLVAPAGYLLTARHAVEKASRVEVIHAERSYPAQVILQDESTDVAVLKIEGTHFPCLPLVPSATAKTGDPVFTMGFPQIQVQGSEGKFTEGSISALSGLRDNPRFFQISVPIFADRQ